MSEEKRNLPKIQDLQNDGLEAFKNDQLNLLLNQPVIEKFVKDHPFAKGVKYIPIDKVEFLLTRIFQKWHVEVLEFKQLFNSVSVHVRLHYNNPITGQWEHQDGLGAVGVQTDKGASASDLNAIKQDAIMKALPAAESYAIKDAAEKLGTIFGKNLNRKDTIGFVPMYGEKPLLVKTNKAYAEELDKVFRGITTIEQVQKYYLLDADADAEFVQAQINAIKAFCVEAGLEDEVMKDWVSKFVCEEKSATDIIDHIKKTYNVQYINN